MPRGFKTKINLSPILVLVQNQGTLLAMVYPYSPL
jgi:hypothetical protein